MRAVRREGAGREREREKDMDAIFCVILSLADEVRAIEEVTPILRDGEA